MSSHTDTSSEQARKNIYHAGHALIAELQNVHNVHEEEQLRIQKLTDANNHYLSLQITQAQRSFEQNVKDILEGKTT